MASPVLELLQQIEAGITIYEPLGRTGRELAEFQDTAHRLLELERQGLIERLITEVREIAGTEYFDVVMVSGLTAEGEHLLAAHQPQEAD